MNSPTQGATDQSSVAGITAIDNTPFYIMGVKNEHFHFYSLEKSKVIALPFSRLKSPWIYSLAPLSWWQERYPSTDKRYPYNVKWTSIAFNLIEQSFAVGKYESLPKFISKVSGVRL